MIKKKIVIIFSFILSPYLLADQLSEIKLCSKVKSDQQRLQCYDKITHSNFNPLQQEIAQVKPSVATVRPIVHNQSHKQQPSLVNIKTPEKTSKVEAFGLINKNGLQSLQSSIVGSFKGWVKGDKITLKNGQVWKVTSQDSGYVKLTNPTIKITTGFLSSFSAKVEGLNARAKIKRIK
jgi:hypothetical protein